MGRKKKIVCPKCKGKLLDIVYGMPGPEMFEKANKHEVYLGGCSITEHDSKYFCPKCHREFLEDMSENDEDEDFECATYTGEMIREMIRSKNGKRN